MKPLRSITGRYIVGAGAAGFFCFSVLLDAGDSAIFSLIIGIASGFIVDKIENTAWYGENGFTNDIAKIILYVAIFVAMYFAFFAVNNLHYLIAAVVLLGGIIWALKLESGLREEIASENVRQQMAQARRRAEERAAEEKRRLDAEEQYRRDAPLRMEKELQNLREEMANMQTGGSKKSGGSAELKRIKEQLAKMTAEKIKAEERARKAEQSGGKRESGLTVKSAQELFEISPPYTAAELKKRRMDLLKKVHPDVGGSNMMAKMVNEAYELLKDNI